MTIAIIGGSRAYDILKDFRSEFIGTLDTPFGTSSPIWEINGEIPYILMSRHGKESYELSAPFVNYRANIYALKQLGAQRIVAWSGPGALHLRYRIGQFVLPHDIIDETRNRKQTFFERRGIGFIRQYPVFCPELSSVLRRVLASIGYGASPGIYVATEGPRLETPAEIQKYKRLGGDLVGMTLSPECFLAKELELCYAPFCYISNYAEGVRHREFTSGELFEGLASPEEKNLMEKAVREIPRVLDRLIPAIHKHNFSCPCSETMKRYKLRGELSEDWREWFK